MMFRELIEELCFAFEAEPIMVTDPKTGKKVPYTGKVTRGKTRKARGAGSLSRDFVATKGARSRAGHRVPKGLVKGEHLERFRQMVAEGGGSRRSKRGRQASAYKRMAPYDSGKKAQRHTVKWHSKVDPVARKQAELRIRKGLADKKGRPRPKGALAKGMHARGDLYKKAAERGWIDD